MRSPLWKSTPGSGCSLRIPMVCCPSIVFAQSITSCHAFYLGILMQLTSLLAALETPPIRIISHSGENEKPGQLEITNLAYDSRKVAPGGLFVAVPGMHTDGRKYLDDAARRGALAAIGPELQDYTTS